MELSSSQSFNEAVKQMLARSINKRAELLTASPCAWQVLEVIMVSNLKNVLIWKKPQTVINEIIVLNTLIHVDGPRGGGGCGDLWVLEVVNGTNLPTKRVSLFSLSLSPRPSANSVFFALPFGRQGSLLILRACLASGITAGQHLGVCAYVCILYVSV